MGMNNEKPLIKVYRSTKKRNSQTQIESNGIDYLRIYHDDIDGGFEFEFPAGVVKELFSKLKKQLNEK